MSDKIKADRQKRKELKVKKNGIGIARKQPVIDAMFKAARDCGKPFKP